VVKDEKLCDILWTRVKSLVPLYIKNSAGEWDAVGLNECFRFCRYTPGQHFSRHCDGAFERNSNEVSFLTFMIYLSESKEGSGGATRFFGGSDDSTERLQPTYKVIPKPGLLLLFHHDNLHDGERVKEGLKYLLRSEVMYKRRLTESEKEDESPMKEREESEESTTTPFTVNFRY